MFCHASRYVKAVFFYYYFHVLVHTNVALNVLPYPRKFCIKLWYQYGAFLYETFQIIHVDCAATLIQKLHAFTQWKCTCSKTTTTKKITRRRCKICSKLTIMTPEQLYWLCSEVSIVNFEHISDLFLVIILLTICLLGREKSAIKSRYRNDTELPQFYMYRNVQKQPPESVL